MGGGNTGSQYCDDAYDPNAASQASSSYGQQSSSYYVDPQNIAYGAYSGAAATQPQGSAGYVGAVATTTSQWVHDPESGYDFNHVTGQYWDPNTKMTYDPVTKMWSHINHRRGDIETIRTRRDLLQWLQARTAPASTAKSNIQPPAPKGNQKTTPPKGGVNKLACKPRGKPTQGKAATALPKPALPKPVVAKPANKKLHRRAVR